MEDVFGNKIEPASTERIESDSTHLTKLLWAIAKPMGWESLEYVWVSDMSSISDFCLEDEDVQKIAQELEVEVNQHDLLVDVITRMMRKTAN